jgi:putative membrane-bound dehydrogenase-like protein
MTKATVRLLTLCWFAAGTLSAADPDPQVQTTQPGVRLSLVAEHSQLATPTGVDVDDQGRVWVVATHTHFRPDDYDGPAHDEILVFDKASDGPADRRVFYNATTATMDLELGNDGWVYLAERDRILRIRDSDGDGQADVEEDIVVLKSEADYPHNGLSGLAWHPDGELVFGLGENFAKPWTLTGSDGVVADGAGEGGIFRCTADGKNLRWIARGLWNPFGVCVRDDGEIFAAENDPGERPPCRLLHIVDTEVTSITRCLKQRWRLGIHSAGNRKRASATRRSCSTAFRTPTVLRGCEPTHCGCCRLNRGPPGKMFVSR